MFRPKLRLILDHFSTAFRKIVSVLSLTKYVGPFAHFQEVLDLEGITPTVSYSYIKVVFFTSITFL